MRYKIMSIVNITVFNRKYGIIELWLNAMPQQGICDYNAMIDIICRDY